MALPPLEFSPRRFLIAMLLFGATAIALAWGTALGWYAGGPPFYAVAVTALSTGVGVLFKSTGEGLAAGLLIAFVLFLLTPVIVVT
jgi:hypothetical protein